jgi:ParB family chromosome partitioning protein
LTIEKNVNSYCYNKTWDSLKLISTTTKLPGIIEDVDMSKIIECRIRIRENDLDELDGLAQSISEHGLLNAIVVRSREDSRYEIVAGNRRFMACKILGHRKIASHVMELDDKSAFEISLMENIQRKTIHPMEEASAFHKYITEYGWGGATELSQKIGKSVSYVTKRIRLLELPQEVVQSIYSEGIKTSAAEELLTISDKDEQTKIAKIITDNNLSVKKIRGILSSKKNLGEGESSWLFSSSQNEYDYRIDKYEKTLDKSITILRIAMTRLSHIASDMSEEHDENWLLSDIIMYHKSQLHQQIDLLIKQKYKKPSKYSRY